MHQILGMGVDRRVGHEGISGQNRRRSQGGPAGRICLHHHRHKHCYHDLHCNEELDSIFYVGALTGVSDHVIISPFHPLSGQIVKKANAPFPGPGRISAKRQANHIPYIGTLTLALSLTTIRAGAPPLAQTK